MFKKHSFFRDRKLFHDHKTISQFRNELVFNARTERLFQECFKFTCVRNPFKMLVSLYNYDLSKGVRDDGFKMMVKNYCDNNRTYFDFIEHDGKNLMNFVMKLEDLEKHTHQVLKMIDKHIKSHTIRVAGLPLQEPILDVETEHHLKGEETNFFDYYSDGKIVDMVNKKFKRELSHFNYNLEDIND